MIEINNLDLIIKRGAVIIFFLFLFIIIYIEFKSPDECGLEKQFEKRQIIGRVIDKYIDLHQHNYPVIKVISKYSDSKEYFELEKSGFYKYVKIGDSIYKPKGTTKIKIIRNNFDTIFWIYYYCKNYSQ